MKQWLSDFKLALIEEDIPKLEILLDELDMKAFVKNLAKNSNSVSNSIQNLSSEVLETNSLKTSENSSENSVKNEKDLKENLNEIFYQIQALLQEAVVLIEQKKKIKAVEIQKFQKALTYFKS